MIMEMTLNEVLIRHNFITKLLLKDGNSELTKELKVKIMGMRIALSKFRNQFDQDAQEAIQGFKPSNFDALAQKQDRTPEEEKELKEMSDKLTEEYNAFVIAKGNELISFDKKFTEEEFGEIMEVNADNDVEINGNKLNAADFLEVIYGLFVA